MNKQNLKQIRNEMIKKLWEKEKGFLTVEDISYIFRLEIAQVYRIIKLGCSRT